MSAPASRFGERLVASGLITTDQVAHGLRSQRLSGRPLGEELVELGYLEEAQVLRALCEEAGIPFSERPGWSAEPAALALIPASMAREKGVLPVRISGGRLLVLAADPFDFTVTQLLEKTSRMRISFVGTPRAPLLAAIERAYAGSRTKAVPAVPVPTIPGSEGSAPPAVIRVPTGERSGARHIDSPAPLPGKMELGIERIERIDRQAVPDPAATPVGLQRHVLEGAGTPAQPDRHSGARFPDEQGDISGGASRIVDEIFERALSLRATDIHVEPREDALGVRLRVDGVLRKGPSYPKSVQAAVLTRIKVTAGLNIAENRLPQDGRLKVSVRGREVDMRVSSFPTLHGEDLVLRVLDRSAVSLDVTKLGMAAEDVELFLASVRRPHGLILLTGPTGSGKSTTLYGALNALNDGSQCIVTLEDPIEYELAGIRQSQINVRAGLTFASGLRALLRHDPDVILVGEMRDAETVQIGMSAAMTGHLVLSTLHTNTAAGAIPRLLDLGAEPYIIASTLKLSVAQRLIRTICTECKEPDQIPDPVRKRFGLGDAPLYRGRGCDACGGLGYRGRIGIYELLPISSAVEQAIHEGRSAEVIQEVAGRRTLLQDGLEKVVQGHTSLEETIRAVWG